MTFSPVLRLAFELVKMDVMSAGAGCLDTKVSIFDSFSSFTLHLDILLNVLAFV